MPPPTGVVETETFTPPRGLGTSGRSPANIALPIDRDILGASQVEEFEPNLVRCKTDTAEVKLQVDVVQAHALTAAKGNRSQIDLRKVEGPSSTGKVEVIDQDRWRVRSSRLLGSGFEDEPYLVPVSDT